jgi:VanZ family protein
MPVVVYMAFIFGLSSIPRPPDLPGEMSDKTGHMALYFGLSVLLVRALAGGWWARVTPWAACLAVVIATAYGVTDEVHQSFVPPRQTDAWDLAADATGASLAALGAYAVSRFRL